ncbi:MAG: alpha-D-glucose phosphate-specific phosphoglucomutase [Rhodobacteraceae bacterium]|nr:alpha-D-glucose phosphate-specific phosphoglucomutase [Paracoccaceae bacterium]MCY4197162.1 alpha-D-glucose phosphate-specific phosphoglucomutase [Paracoccaceae bacterium]
MDIQFVETEPFEGQVPGTSGLRKKTRIFQQPSYLENYVQAIFNTIDGVQGGTFVIGGDGRFFNDVAIGTIIRMAVANRVGKLIVGRSGLLSTPAAAHMIRKSGAIGGFILSASHNPAGIDGDFGIKFNIASGGPAPESMTTGFAEAASRISRYATADVPNIDLNHTDSSQDIGDTSLTIVDPVDDYLALMEELFDFAALRRLFSVGFTLRFDAMHAVTGPYAKRILEDELGAPAGTVINRIPQPDFGGQHPDPNPVWARSLVDVMMSPQAPDMGAASDGDGDRNMIIGRGVCINPSDSLAILAANAHLAPAYSDGIVGIARSMPTSSACDRVAEKLGIRVYETPTGWKFFDNLLNSGRVSICGEESAGTGSYHVREKDGLWAILLWLSIVAAREMSVTEILHDHWRAFGRNYYSRYDFENIPAQAAASLMDDLRSRLDRLAITPATNLRVTAADEFSYHDPVDSSVSTGQGIRIFFANGARAVFRLSGTGTTGATLRIYLERYEPPDGNLHADSQTALEVLWKAVVEISCLQAHVNRIEPDVRV